MIIALPLSLEIGPGGGIEQVRYDMAEVSDASGDTAVRVGAPPRWRLTVVPPESLEPRAANVWRSLLLRLDGPINHLEAGDWMRPVPIGTARGPIVLATAAAAGATSIDVSGATAMFGAPTLEAGDWLQVGSGLGSSQLVQVVAPVSLTGGAGTVEVRAPLRRAYAAGSAVTWDRPVTYFRRPPDAVGTAWRYDFGGLQSGLSLTALEAFG